ncbi:MAG: hypothetical protein IJ719_00820 [Clostridia bacterium]|nr:hypothetical protein [Clostridia bacterium]
MLIYLNGVHNFIIIPKETLEELGNPKFCQIMSNGESILLRYSKRKLAESIIIEYPLKSNSFGLHIRDEKNVQAIRKRYNFDNYIYAVDAVPLLNILAIDPHHAKKTEISNSGL